MWRTVGSDIVNCEKEKYWTSKISRAGLQNSTRASSDAVEGRCNGFAQLGEEQVVADGNHHTFSGPAEQKNLRELHGPKRRPNATVKSSQEQAIRIGTLNTSATDIDVVEHVYRHFAH